MAEPCLQDRSTMKSGSHISLLEAPGIADWAHASPLWRSLLTPPVGQRVLILDSMPEGIFETLRELESSAAKKEWAEGEAAGSYDLVLEEVRTDRRRPRPRPSRTSLVAPGGRWVAVVQGTPAVGWHGRAVLRQARSGGFEKIETFYAHPSLSAPKVLVPLDRIEPIRYFLDFAMGVPTLRKRCVALGFPLLARLGIHREVLPNMILSARRRS
jgi:hypothetical protein